MSEKVLLVIDVQEAVVASGYRRDETIDAINTVIEKARSSHTPILYVQHEFPEGSMKRGEDGWQLHHHLISPRENDRILYKTLPNAFASTNFENTLLEIGAKHLYICGAQTDFCVDSTCRGAFDRGYHITLIKGAHTTDDSEILSASKIIEHTERTLSHFWSPNASISFETVEEITF